MPNRYEVNWMGKYEQQIIKVLNDLLADEVSPTTKRLALHVISDGAITENGELNNKTHKIGEYYVTSQAKNEIDECLRLGNLIKAIKILRESGGMTLVAAKNAMDAYDLWRRSTSHTVNHSG